MVLILIIIAKLSNYENRVANKKIFFFYKVNNLEGEKILHEIMYVPNQSNLFLTFYSKYLDFILVIAITLFSCFLDYFVMCH